MYKRQDRKMIAIKVLVFPSLSAGFAPTASSVSLLDRENSIVVYVTFTIHRNGGSIQSLYTNPIFLPPSLQVHNTG